MKSSSFKVDSYDDKYAAKPHLELGFLEMGTDAVFRTLKDGLNCFGYKGGHFQHALWKLPDTNCEAIDLPKNSCVWFPQLNARPDWENSLSDDGTLIIEKNLLSDSPRLNKWQHRIVMAKSRDNTNKSLYRFIGVFEIIPEYSEGSEHRFRRVSKRVKTYVE